MNYIHRFLSLVLILVSSVSTVFAGETVTFLSEDGLLITADIHAPHQNSKAPVIVLFLLAQKTFIRGIATTGLKG